MTTEEEYNAFMRQASVEIVGLTKLKRQYLVERDAANIRTAILEEHVKKMEAKIKLRGYEMARLQRIISRQRIALRDWRMLANAAREVRVRAAE